MTQQAPDPSRTDHTQPPGVQPTPAAPAPGWAPAPLSSGGRPTISGEQAAPHDNGGTLGAPAHRSVKIDEFAPPRSRLPLIIVLVAVLTAALIWAGTTLRPTFPATGANPSPSPTATSTAAGLPFITPDGRYSGRWQILQHQWTDWGLEVEIRIAAEKGPISYSFMAFDNTSVEATQPDVGSQAPRFTGLPIKTGREETGWLFFPLERGPSTIILATAAGNQMSALAVPG